jgi:hypothetical protein
MRVMAFKWVAAQIAPVMLLSVHAVPWWIVIALAFTWPAAYICRWYLLYRLVTKALSHPDRRYAASIIKAVCEAMAEDFKATRPRPQRSRKLRQAR